MTGGYWNRVLRVDLTTRTWRIDPLPDEKTLRMYLGGTAYAMKILLDEVRPGQAAADAATPMIFATGPLAGTPAPSSSNLAVTTLSFNTPYAVSTSHTHGYFAAYLRHAGWDAVVVTGQSKSPVYLWIDDERVEIRDAGDLWGQDTRETERLIKRQLGDEAKISVLCIGPAGEAMLPGASLRNDRNHGAHKGSPGAMMGCKRLKAIAVRGTGTVPLHNPEAFLENSLAWDKAAHTTPADGSPPPVGVTVGENGPMHLYRVFAAKSLSACKNLSDPAWAVDSVDQLANAMANEFIVVKKGSYNCSIACSYDCTITSGPYAGMTASMCGGSENIEGAAAMVGIDDPAQAVVITDYYDSIGMDSAVGGALIGMCFELFNKGHLSLEQTGGLDLTWGNMESVMSLLNQMIEGRGFGGSVLAKGLKEAARLLGPAAEACVVHIRGGGPNMHDFRGVWSILLGQVLSSGAGVAWQGMGTDTFMPSPELGLPTLGTPHVPEGKADAFLRTQRKKLFEDSLGTCWFTTQGIHNSLTFTTRAIREATGWDDFNEQEALLVGERTVVAQRVLALRRGFKPSDEFDVSNRVLEAPVNGAQAGTTIKPHLERMVREYYDLMGWDLATGEPSRATLERVGLADLAG